VSVSPDSPEKLPRHRRPPSGAVPDSTTSGPFRPRSSARDSSIDPIPTSPRRTASSSRSTRWPSRSIRPPWPRRAHDGGRRRARSRNRN